MKINVNISFFLCYTMTVIMLHAFLIYFKWLKNLSGLFDVELMPILFLKGFLQCKYFMNKMYFYF